MLLYIVLVPGLIATLWAQWREKGLETPPTTTLPNGFRLGLRLVGALIMIVGGVLYIFPGTAEQLWPWTLTPLTARMVGSFYLAIAVSLLVAAKENDYARIHVASFAYLFGVILQVIGMVRYPVVNWQSPSGQLLALVMLSLFVIGIVGIRGYVIARSDRK